MANVPGTVTHKIRVIINCNFLNDESNNIVRDKKISVKFAELTSPDKKKRNVFRLNKF